MTKKNIIQEAVTEVKKMRDASLQSAKKELAEAMTPVLQRLTSRRVNEELGAGGDPPGNYDEDGEQKRLGDNEPVVGDTGEDMSDDGDGPAIIEMDFEDGEEDFVDEEEEMDFEEEDDSELDLGFDEEAPADDMGMDDEEDVIEIVEDDMEDDLDDGDDLDMGIDVDIEPEPEEEEEKFAMENKKLRIANRKLALENRKFARALTEMTSKVKEINLFNARLSGFNKLQSEVTLTKGEKNNLINRFDECESVGEVKKMYRALREAYQSSGKTNKRTNRVKRSNGSIRNTLNENFGNQFTRMQELANLK